jgi:hypothetical protein
MARPIKTGLDYFPKDTSSFSDRKIRKLLNEFGPKGYTIFDYLLCVIYSDQGYYVKYDDELAFDVADFLGCGINEELVKEVVKGCIRVGLFNQGLFDMFKILTSSGIQKRYKLAKRNAVIDEKIAINEEETEVIAAETIVIPAISTQSKVKKSKVKKSKEKRAEALIVADATNQPDQKDLKKKYFDLVEQITGKDLATVVGAMKSFIQEHQPKFIEPYYNTGTYLPKPIS